MDYMFISAMNNRKPGVIHSILVGYQWKVFVLPNSVQFSSVQSLSCVRLFATPLPIMEVLMVTYKAPGTDV